MSKTKVKWDLNDNVEARRARDVCGECGSKVGPDGGMKFSGDPSDPLDGAPDYDLCGECCANLTALANSAHPHYYVDAEWLARYGDDLIERAQVRRNGRWESMPELPGSGDWLGSNGFAEFYKSEAGPLGINVYVRNGALPGYYVTVHDFDASPGVYADTLADVMDVLSQWLPVISHAALLDVADALSKGHNHPDRRREPRNTVESLMDLIRHAERAR
ncbi:hypothetical protein [Nocardioides terrisoli]|uniref:hypothetical protein n=1 Tax=Nocardioides terrisoli TaxID=3388267 RepID=UPI00287B7871|nr:hypothetical protein [Nocardioides marmorisolisilvae]